VRYVKASLPVVLATTVSGCALRSNPKTEMYVCTEPAVSTTFTQVLGSMLRTASFSPSLGRAVDVRGGKNFVLEAKKELVWVWAQNMPVSPPLERSEADYLGVSVDPNQYIVSVQSWAPFLQSPEPVYDRLRSQLIRARFQVHDRPDECNPSGR
jgi:hypothetical protein